MVLVCPKVLFSQLVKRLVFIHSLTCANALHSLVLVFIPSFMVLVCPKGLFLCASALHHSFTFERVSLYSLFYGVSDFKKKKKFL